MSKVSFDLSLQPLGISIAVPQPGEGDELEVVVVVGMMLPFGGPQGPMVIPMGQIRFPMGRDFAENFADSLKQEAEKLPKESGLVQAQSMQQVDQVAKLDRSIRGE